MCFPKDFNGQVQWVGFPLRRGASLRFAVEYLGGLSDFRMVNATLCVNNQSIALEGRAPTLNVNDLDGYDSNNPWARDNIQRQTRAITGKFKRLRLTVKGHGFMLEAYFGDREPADLVWLYKPEGDQPRSAELCSDALYVQSTPICEIPEYQVLTDVRQILPGQAVAA